MAAPSRVASCIVSAACGCLLTLSLGCGDEFTNAGELPVTLQVAGAWPDTLLVGDTVPITIQLFNGSTPVRSAPLRWHSSNPEVLEIEPGGFTSGGDTALLIAREPGIAPVAVDNAAGNGLGFAHDSASIVVMERWRDVSAGGTITCGVTSRLATYCWGGEGQGLGLGDGLAEGSAVPVRIAGVAGLPLTTVSASFGHACALASSSALERGFPYCWGDNLNGTTGNDTQGPPTILPTPVSGSGRFSEIAVGGNMACAADGDVPSGVTSGSQLSNTACWGIGAPEAPLTPSGMPFPIGWGSADGNFVLHGIAIGRSHGCGLLLTTAYCWGFGLTGELGDGQKTSHPNDPVRVSGAIDFAAITAGVEHTCALDTGGLAYCWGGNTTGELGQSLTTTDAATPALVHAGGVTFMRISAAGGIGVVNGALEIWGHTCALSTDSLAYCWGRNTAGELGVGSAGPESCAIGPCTSTPLQVSTGLKFAVISTGEGLPDGGPTTHTCAITAKGALYCWGDNGQGQLGNPAGGESPSRVLNP